MLEGLVMSESVSAPVTTSGELSKWPLCYPWGCVQSSISQSSSVLSINGKKPWLLDSGAIDHLAESYDNSLSYLSSIGNEKIRITDVSFAPIVGKGYFSPFDGLILQNVLHVPRISYNLLYLNCQVAFPPDIVFFFKKG